MHSKLSAQWRLIGLRYQRYAVTRSELNFLLQCYSGGFSRTNRLRLSLHVEHLLDRIPEITAREIVAYLVPPQQFDSASFESYVPDANHPSQEQAREFLMTFAGVGVKTEPPARSKGGLFSRNKSQQSVSPDAKQGVYLDGGFGVGKTHLLAALWHTTPGRKYFGTFIQYTALVGALGYQQAIDTLRGAKLICIDEFELDDPGDTMIMTRMIGELAESGCKFAATSNTPPNALGEGRFAAADFLREIQAIANRFTTLRIDGEDYRHRDSAEHAHVLSPADYAQAFDAGIANVKLASDDDFGALVAHLSKVHPSTYVRMIEGIDLIGLRNAHTLESQAEALRFVAFIDRVYDAQIPVLSTGVALDSIFSDEMLAGGYSKKYRRCMSRLVALTSSTYETEPLTESRR